MLLFQQATSSAPEHFHERTERVEVVLCQAQDQGGAKQMYMYHILEDLEVLFSSTGKVNIT